MIGIGPKEKWEHNLSKLSRAALVILVTDLQWRLRLYSSSFDSSSFDNEKMISLIDQAKKYGRWDNAEARYAKFLADPDKAIKQQMRRSRAAKRARRQAKRRTANGR